VAPHKPASFFTFGSSRTLTFVNRRATVSITVPGAGRASAALRAGVGGTVRTLSTATGTATRAGAMRFTLRLSASNARLLRRTVSRRPTGRVAGTLRVSYTPTGGTRRTRNKALSIGIR
jgi:hypothetical protein